MSQARGWRRLAAARVGLVGLVGLVGGPGGCGDDGVSSTSGAASTGASGASSGAGSSGEGSSGEGSGGESSGGGGGTGCASHAPGEWNSCKDGPLILTGNCGWSAAEGKSGAVLCVGPASGGGNACSVRDCVDVCDCFAPPSTGSAVLACVPVLGDGGSACVLQCASGQTCPDGMECISGSCYWPS